MSYEDFRVDVITGLSPILPEDKLPEVVNVVDNVATHYDVKHKELNLSIVGNIPEVVKIYLAAKATQRLSQGTLVNYYNILKNFFLTVQKDIYSIETNDIRNYLFRYQQARGVSNRSLEGIRVALNSFFLWCVNDEIIQKNPCARVDPIPYYAKQREVLDPLEMEMLRAECKTLREKAVIDLLYSCGCRVTELCNLDITDINFSDRSVRIRHGKGDKDRTTYFNAESSVSLQRYLASRTDDCPALIVNERKSEKHRIGKRAIETLVKNIGDRANVSRDKTKPHNFRHTFATTLIGNGCPVHHVQRMLGHAKISTTMIYTTIADDDVRRNHARCVI